MNLVAEGQLMPTASKSCGRTAARFTWRTRISDVAEETTERQSGGLNRSGNGVITFERN